MLASWRAVGMASRPRSCMLFSGNRPKRCRPAPITTTSRMVLSSTKPGRPKALQLLSSHRPEHERDHFVPRFVLADFADDHLYFLVYRHPLRLTVRQHRLDVDSFRQPYLGDDVGRHT